MSLRSNEQSRVSLGTLCLQWTVFAFAALPNLPNVSCHPVYLSGEFAELLKGCGRQSPIPVVPWQRIATRRVSLSAVFKLRWQAGYPTMVRQLEKDLPQLLAFFNFPNHLWKQCGPSTLLSVACGGEVSDATDGLLCQRAKR